MSNEVYVFLKGADFPSVKAWQTTMRQAGFLVTLHSDFDPIKDSGFVPCTFREEEAGCEYFLSPINNVSSAYPELAEAIVGYDSAATFSWGGRLSECAVALAAAATLAASSSGTMYDPQQGALYDGPNGLEYARGVLQQISLML